MVRTRRYAKRQRTWMRRVPDLLCIDADRDPDAGRGADHRGDRMTGRREHDAVREARDALVILVAAAPAAAAAALLLGLPQATSRPPRSG